LTYIIDAVRVPISKANGAYKNTLPENLVAFLLQKIALRNNIFYDQIDEVIIANAFGT
jgi:acetyl-CoA acetyltransferase